MSTYTRFIPISSFFSLCIALFLSCEQTVTSQEVPAAVQANFEKMYPREQDPDWHIDAHGFYEAHFKKKGIHYRADFEKNGAWFETETNIKKKELPEAIRIVIKERFNDLKISEIEKVQSAGKGLFYDVEFKRKGKNKDVEFKEDGTILFITP